MSKSESYDKWIGKPENRESLNKRRRERYASDEQYRKRAIKQSKRARKNSTSGVQDPYTIHIHSGVEYKVYKIGYVLEKLGVSVGVFNRVCKSNLIPFVFKVGSHRMLTKVQIKLVRYVLKNETIIPNKTIIDKLNKEWLEQ